MTPDLLSWMLFAGIVSVMFILDLSIFHRKAHAVPIKEAIYTSLFWIFLALLFNVYIYYAKGREDAINFLTGYLIEKSLSVDNLFVFLLIFRYFHTPTTSMHTVLFWGIFGAIILRAIFIGMGIVLITKFHWLIYIFGAFLIYTGIHLAWEEDKKIEPEKNPILRLFRRYFPMTENYVSNKFFIRQAGKTLATPLFATLLAIESSDIIFAVDSIPAILAITYDPFIVFTSNIFAILGLRSLYFVLSHMMGLFHYLNYGLAVILTFIGIKMCVSDLYHIPTSIALGLVFLVLAVSILVSLLYPKNNSQ